MQYLANGACQFDSLGELYYNLFMTIGLGINSQQYLYDQDTGIVIKFKDKFIKANTNNQPLYAGRMDVVFEPSKNYGLMTTLVGYYIDKESNSEDGDRIGFISMGIEDKDIEWHRVIVQTNYKGIIESKFYRQAYLGYIEVIFQMDGVNVDLTNLDEMTYVYEN
jgi:hypothetical protein